MADKMYVACPRCGAFGVTERKFWGGGWKELTCTSCKMKFDYTEAAAQIQSCENCQTVVAYTREKDETCPACRQPLSNASRMRAIGCPVCESRVTYLAGETRVTCPNMRCKHVFNPEEVTQHTQGVVENSAPDIRMTGTIGEDQLIWRHDKLPELLPLDAQIIAAPGMRAVGLKGTTVVFQADARNVKLSETELRNSAAEYDGASVPLTNVDVYYVRYNLGSEVPWGGKLFLSDAYGVRTEFKMHGDVLIEAIEEPAAFMRAFGYEPNKVLRSMFGSKPGPDGYLPENTRKVQARVNGILQRAMEAVRDANALTTDDMAFHQDLIREEVERQANMAVADFGLKLNITRCTATKGDTVVVHDTLERRVAGPISWKLDRAVRVHEPEDSTSWVELLTKGRFYVEVQDRDRFHSCSDAYAWRDPNKSDSIVRQEFVDMVVDQMYSCVKSQLQLIVNETGCSLDDLDTFEANLRRKGCALLNGEDGFFGSRGLAVRDMTVTMTVENKSLVYSGKRNVIEKGNLVDIKQQSDKLDTRMFVGEKIEEEQRKDVMQDIAKRDLKRDLEMEELQAQADMRRQELEAMKARQQREFSFEVWADRQRQLEAQDEVDYARRRRAREEQYKTNVSDAEHKAHLKEIARRIDESDLAWNEKLDAYARLQRGVAFQDQLGEREALAEAEAREKRLERVLRTEDIQALKEIRREEELHQENLAKQRFARALEMRRQKMAEDTARLQAQYERERAIAQEHETRMKSREEVETLRLMLEYLAKSGEQQVTAEALREARQEAQLKWEREHAEAERKEALREEERQRKAESDMAAQAMQLLSMANAAQESAATQKDDKSKAAADDIQKIINELNGIRSALESNKEREAAAEVVNGMDAWFDGFLSRIGKRTTPYRPATRAAGVGVVCRNCGKVFDENAFKCPHCGWIG